MSARTHLWDVHLGLEEPEEDVADEARAAQRAAEQEARKRRVEEGLKLEHLR